MYIHHVFNQVYPISVYALLQQEVFDNLKAYILTKLGKTMLFACLFYI